MSDLRGPAFDPDKLSAMLRAIFASTPDVSKLYDFSKFYASIAQSANLGALVNLQLAPMIESLSRLSLGSRRGTSADRTENSAYSDEMRSPEDFFSANEGVIESFDDLHYAIQELVARNPSIQLAWRGQRDSRWGLHSSLFRALVAVNGVRLPSKLPHRRSEPYPTEEEMVAAERHILDVARDAWRIDGTSALEIFARLQHFGAPTRLLDVSRNPYIAAWFAVERSNEHDVLPGRLFALGTHPVLPAAQKELATELTQVRGLVASSYEPFWHVPQSSVQRQELEWGTGAIRRFWIPPVYERRILAQNGAFVLDGVPLSISGMASYFKLPGESSRYWRRADLLAAASIYTKVYSPSRKVAENRARAFPPTFTFRITADAKRDIRAVLEERFSFSAATLYPDTEGLAQFLRSELPAALRTRG